jgi:hypothetical protein
VGERGKEVAGRILRELISPTLQTLNIAET